MTQGRIRDVGGPADGRPGERDYARYEDEEYLEPLPAAEAAREGLRLITTLAGREPQGVVSLESTDEGWRVGVEVVEDHRIPASTTCSACTRSTSTSTGNCSGTGGCAATSAGRARWAEMTSPRTPSVAQLAGPPAAGAGSPGPRGGRGRTAAPGGPAGRRVEGGPR